MSVPLPRLLKMMNQAEGMQVFLNRHTLPPPSPSTLPQPCPKPQEGGLLGRSLNKQSDDLNSNPALPRTGQETLGKTHLWPSNPHPRDGTASSVILIPLCHVRARRSWERPTSDPSILPTRPRLRRHSSICPASPGALKGPKEREGGRACPCHLKMGRAIGV